VRSLTISGPSALDHSRLAARPGSMEQQLEVPSSWGGPMVAYRGPCPIPTIREAAELFRGYRDFPFLEKPFTFLKLCGILAPLLKSRRFRPWRRASGSWRSLLGRGDEVDS
jgi:hypothetical protein